MKNYQHFVDARGVFLTSRGTTLRSLNNLEKMDDDSLYYVMVFIRAKM